MGDFIGFKGHLNTSTPFNLAEYDAVWKRPPYSPWDIQEYPDFKFSNERNSSCQLPTFWTDDGTIVEVPYDGCYASEFDQFGDMEAFGVHPDWQRQLSKFASVQDRLREWQPDVMAKLKLFSCMFIEAMDIDGIRIDKATQVTLDALADWTTSTHTCAKTFGKDNFFIPGEVTGGDRFGSLYIGRGRTVTQRPPGFIAASDVTPDQTQFFLRDQGHIALDAVAFHYSIYRSLTRFLGMDGNLQVAYDIDVNFVTAWNQMFVNNDFLNKETGEVDPRHMYGVSNFDVFRWPALANGTLKNMLGGFITSLVMPGIPLYYYGEEQAFYVLDNGAANYLFGRQPMTSSRAWQRHGCYVLDSAQYFGFPLERALNGCHDEWNSLDHFDPTAPPRRIISRFNHLRSIYPALQDGFNLVQWGNKTHFIELPGSNHSLTELGLWYVSRAALPSVQNFTGDHADQVYLLYTNENKTAEYTFDCMGDEWITSPYVSGTTVRNLFAPYETYTLQDSRSSYFNDSNAPYRGCLPSVTFEPFSFKALVPEEMWVGPHPMLTAFSPGHDARIMSTGASNDREVAISLDFNMEMSCDGVTAALSLAASSSGSDLRPRIQDGSVVCHNVHAGNSTYLPGDVSSAWRWSATLSDVPDGIIELILTNAPSVDGTDSTHAIDHLLIRKGTRQNVMVFPESDYDTGEALKIQGDKYVFNHQAKGADLFRYSWNFGRNYTSWVPYEDATTIPKPVFDQCEECFWEGQHIIVQYWAELSSSSAHIVHADYGYAIPRRVPQLLVRGPYNTWGYDKGVTANMQHNKDGVWELEVMAQWPSYVQVNVFGFDDYFYGDTDGDGVMERLPPNTVAPNFLNMSVPPQPHLAWALLIDDSTGKWTLEPRGHSVVGAVMFVLLLVIPLLTATSAVAVFRWAFYTVKHNKWGTKSKESHFRHLPIFGSSLSASECRPGSVSMNSRLTGWMKNPRPAQIIGWPEDPNKRRKILIATLEYEIMDWKLKVKIGGLGVMSSLMGKAMDDVDLVWVVPKVKDLEYPSGDRVDPIEVTIFGDSYLIEVETHTGGNITYVILDSPVFRAQTKSDPYPARMDDLSSAIFYSTWNQAIAATIRRFPQIDIYHVNDYHGALAPIYLLPKVIPVCLSLHNAEFQGLWPLRNKEEMQEVCSAFNISKEHCTKYVQFGNTFNLLHAAASFISLHQRSVGVAGVSDKYGKRSWARYPALWTLKHVDSLPNPDPSDIAALEEKPVSLSEIQVDEEAEAERPEHKRKAQEWAKLEQDPNADLFVFVGRWSKQKGVDLIADVMPSILEKRPSVQLICVGPVIDLYGRFAAEKLARIMELYPGRVYSKPEFTALPPFLFSGADFALIPSRDEPFGLVAVEFGRKGALGVGSRLGGLGLMPGWWFPVESNSTAHMVSQFTKTIKLALDSSHQERAILRARSAIQRFPVVEWRQKMENFHKRSITASRTLAGDDAWRESDCQLTYPAPDWTSTEWTPEVQLDPSRPGWATESLRSCETPTIVDSFSTSSLRHAHSFQDFSVASSRFLVPVDASARSSLSADCLESEPSERSRSQDSQPFPAPVGPYSDFLARANQAIAKEIENKGTLSSGRLSPALPPYARYHSRQSSMESITSIVNEKPNSPLNKAMASFDDKDGEVTRKFVDKLQELTAENSKGPMSIERFLVKNEEEYFVRIKREKISSAASVLSSKRDSWWDGVPSLRNDSHQTSSISYGPSRAQSTDENPLVPDLPIMTSMQIKLAQEFYGWPVYAIILALGQMLGATSFQITLLSGQNYQGDIQLYVLGCVFFVASLVWYTLFRLKPSVYVLSYPWLFYGLAFFLVGLPSVSDSFGPTAHSAITSLATWCYAVASAAAFLFFGLNFGEEAGAATEKWTLRACIVQGSQQIWVTALWYWGHRLNGALPGSRTPWWIVILLWPMATICFCFVWCLLTGLPDYYRQTPPKVPNFIKTLFRRKLVLWFLASELLRDYWLSGPYGRNWSFLWSTSIPSWQILLLVILFFVGIWGVALYILMRLGKTHTWILPVFAVGLGAPRWCQMLWGTSSLALYIPWAGRAGPYLGTSLWLWLGVLDAIQGVGLGMILLQTLSRLHVCATLAFAQLLGCICVMVARATAPNRIGPGSVFPDASKWDFSKGLEGSPMASGPFWVAMLCQIVIVVGYFWFYRKEQLGE
ncbi:putative cell wall alpha-1,3-glucan synthase [Serendipita vermifera]|nr:putative cell wall alpha-1,3-glucan synthase [Serendipita vermifera]